jgi:hypothetical protein
MFKRNWDKFNSTKTIIYWIKFSSKLEARFYEYLKNNKDIQILELQPRFILQNSFKYEWKTIRAIEYVRDFKIEYLWDIFYIDAKWMTLPVFQIKHKLWLKKYWDENILIIRKSIKELEKLLLN